MKKLILLTLLSFNLAAEDKKEEPVSCETISILAETIMSARQQGVAMSDIINLGKDDKLLKILTIEAYEKPRYSTQKNQDQTTQDFKNDVYLECLKQGGE